VVHAEYRLRVGSDRGAVSDLVIAECLRRRRGTTGAPAHLSAQGEADSPSSLAPI